MSSKPVQRLVPGLAGLHRETLSQTRQNKQTKKKNQAKHTVHVEMKRAPRGAEETEALWLRALVALSEDLVSIPRTHRVADNSLQLHFSGDLTSSSGFHGHQAQE